MSRKIVRSMNKAVGAGLRVGASTQEQQAARLSAVALLERSVKMGHDRLALLRLQDAVRMNASLSPQHWRYCEQVVRQRRDPALQDLLFAAAASAGVAGS